MQRATGFTDRGLTDRAHLAVLNNNKAAAALAEIGFLSNPTEAKALIPRNLPTIAASIKE